MLDVIHNTLPPRLRRVEGARLRTRYTNRLNPENNGGIRNIPLPPEEHAAAIVLLNCDHDDSACTAVARRSSVIYIQLYFASRVASVLDLGAEGPGFKSQSRRCRVLGKLFIPIVPLFTKHQKWQQPP